MTPKIDVRRLMVVLCLAVLSAGVVACSDESSTSAETKASSSSATDGSNSSKGIGASQPSPGTRKPSEGCSAAPPTSDLVNEARQLDSEGEARDYLVTIPAAASTAGPVPVVVDLHGLLEGDVIHSTMSKFSDLGIKEGFAVITPNGSGVPLGWKASKPYETNTDMVFINKVMDTVESEFCIDTTRRYATGLSNGAIMTSALACAQPLDFAAVAPVAGIGTLKECDSKTPMPVLAIHGTADPILVFNGGVGDLSQLLGTADPSAAPQVTALPEADLNGPGYPSHVAEWAKRNGCEPKPTDSNLPHTDGNPDLSVIRRVYDCPKGQDTEFYIVVGGGHSWPGSEFSKSIGAIVGPTSFDFMAAEVQWEFFKKFHR